MSGGGGMSQTQHTYKALCPFIRSCVTLQTKNAIKNQDFRKLNCVNIHFTLKNGLTELLLANQNMILHRFEVALNFSYLNMYVLSKYPFPEMVTIWQYSY